MTALEPEFVDLSQVQPGPVRNESLPLEMLEQIKAMFDVIGEYFGTALGQVEIGFMRDMNPETEVIVWCSIAGLSREVS